MELTEPKDLELLRRFRRGGKHFKTVTLPAILAATHNIQGVDTHITQK